jgi:hypothetical protein
MKGWKMVKTMLPFLGTFPFFLMLSGSMRTREPGLVSSKAEKAL